MITFPPPRAAHYSDARSASWLALALLVLFSAAAAAQDRSVSAAFSTDVEQRVTALTNDFRQQNGLPPLELEARLTEAARYFAGYLASTGKLDHDADGTTPPERVKKRGYSYCAVAENLASEYNSAGFAPDRLSMSFVQGWRDSPTHRDNMLLPEITQIGVGVARSPKDGEYFGVQVFARPTSQMVKFRVTNRSNATVRYEFRKRTVTLGPKQGRIHESCAGGDLRLDTGGQGITVRSKDGARYAVVDAGGGGFRWQEE
jgi:uncharacterized protein YkwD